MAQTGLGCHGNRDRSKGQNLESKPGQSETVTEATPGAKRERAKGQGALESPLALECLKGTPMLLTSKKPFYYLSLTGLLVPAQIYSATRFGGNGSIFKQFNCDIVLLYGTKTWF